MPWEDHRAFFLSSTSEAIRYIPKTFSSRYTLTAAFKVLQAFIQHEFKDLPGSTWVNQGRYLVSSLTNNRMLEESNWSGFVAPGSTIAMSMVVRKHPFESSNSNEDRCPESSCSGTWTKSNTQSWSRGKFWMVFVYLLFTDLTQSYLPKANSELFAQ